VPPVRRLGHVGYDQSFVMSSSASAPGPGLFNVPSTPSGAARSARASGSSGGSTTTPETAPHLVIGAYPWAEACAPRKPAPGFEIALYALALLTLPATVPPPPARALLAHATARPLSPRASLPSGSACLCVVPLPTPLSGISVLLRPPGRANRVCPLRRFVGVIVAIAWAMGSDPRDAAGPPPSLVPPPPLLRGRPPTDPSPSCCPPLSLPSRPVPCSLSLLREMTLYWWNWAFSILMLMPLVARLLISAAGTVSFRMVSPLWEPT